jgi:hypothetical protein
MRVRATPVETADQQIDVPASPFALISGITSLLTTLVTVFTFWFVTKPDADQTRMNALHKNQTDMLQRALQVETADGRRNSLRLLVGLGMIGTDQKIDLSGFLTPKSDTLPLWPAAPARGGGERPQLRDTVGNTTTRR